MPVFYIILVFFALIAILLFIDIKVSLCYKEGFFLKVKYIITVYDSDNKRPTKEKKSRKKDKGEKESGISKLKGFFSSFDSLLELFKTLKNLLSTFGRYLKKVKVYNTEFSLTVAGEDAALTAVKYGLACSVIYPTLTLLSSTVNFNPKQIDVNSDFTSNNFFVGIYTDLSVKPIYIIGFVISFAWIYIKSRIERNKK